MIIDFKYGVYGPCRSCNTGQIWIARAIKYFQDVKQWFLADVPCFHAPRQLFPFDFQYMFSYCEPYFLPLDIFNVILTAYR